MSNGDGNAAQVERQIQRTRVELAATLDALEDKLAPRHLLEKGVDMWNENLNGSEQLQRGLDAIRANPLPIALIGIGAAWLIAGQLINGQQVAAVRRRVSDMIEPALGHTGSALIDETGSGERQGWTHQLADRAAGAASTVRDWSGAVSTQAGNIATDGANRVADQLNGAARRYPLAMTAVATLAGAALAMLLPTSRAEDDLLGGARETFGSRVREAASRAAGAAVDAATTTIKAEMDNPPRA